jgi:hypothetical protein
VQTVPGISKPASQDPPAAHAAARAALRELVDLCAQCATRENEIEQEHKAALEQAERELGRGKSNAEMRFKSVREEVAAKAAARIAEIQQQFAAEVQKLKADDAGKRRQVIEEHDRAAGEINSKMQQATWLAESVFEGAQNGIRADSKKAKERLATATGGDRRDDASARRAHQDFPAQTPAALPRPPPTTRGPPAGVPDRAGVRRAQRAARPGALGDQAAVVPKLFGGVKPFLIVTLIRRDRRRWSRTGRC